MQNIYNAPDKEKLLPQNLTIKKRNSSLFRLVNRIISLFKDFVNRMFYGLTGDDGMTDI